MIFEPDILGIRIRDGIGWSADIIRKAKRDVNIYVRFRRYGAEKDDVSSGEGKRALHDSVRN